MYSVTLYAGEMGPIVHEFVSVAKVRSWMKFNNYVLGTPAQYCATFAIEHTDGSALSSDELQSLQPGDSHSTYQERIANSGHGYVASLGLGPEYGEMHQRLLTDDVARNGRRVGN